MISRTNKRMIDGFQVRLEILAGIQKVNRKAISNAQKVKFGKQSVFAAFAEHDRSGFPSWTQKYHQSDLDLGFF